MTTQLTNPFQAIERAGIAPHDVHVLAKAFTLTHGNDAHQVFAMLRMARSIRLPMTRGAAGHRIDSYHSLLDGPAFAEWHNGHEGFPIDAPPEVINELAILAYDYIDSHGGIQ